MVRKFCVGGNWKMNGDKATIADIGKNLSEPGLDANTEVVIGCPAIYLEYARSVLPAAFGVAGQNCWKVCLGTWFRKPTRKII